MALVGANRTHFAHSGAQSVDGPLEVMAERRWLLAWVWGVLIVWCRVFVRFGR